MEDSIKYIKNKFSTSFNIEIVKIDKKSYYLIKIKNGSVFTEKSELNNFLDRNLIF